jgi:DNA-binding NarL/FixJ family response regulator
MNVRQVADHGVPPNASAPSIRILIVDDHPLIRQVVRETLEEEPDLSVCAEAADDPEARRLVASAAPHVALVDLSLGDSYGIDLVKWIATNYPAVRILVLSMHDSSLYARRAFQAGAHGYINKRDASFTMIKTIRNVMAQPLPPTPPPG